MPVFRFARRWSARNLLTTSLCALVSCRAADSSRMPSAAPHDDFGTAIETARTPQRIVSLNPTTTEILVALGAKPRMVGRSQYDTFPDSVTSVPSLGIALRPSVEAVLAVHPDLVILYASEDNRPAYDRLRGAGITTLAFKIDSIAQFDRDTRLLGRLTGDSLAANTLVDTVRATLARVRAATASLPHPSVFYPTWDKPIIAIGGGSFLSELLDIAGATNIYARVHAPSVTVTIEDVVQRDPDIVITGKNRAEQLRASPMWRAVSAVRGGNVMVIDEDLVTRPSVQLGAAAVALARLIHPGSVR